MRFARVSGVAICCGMVIAGCGADPTHRAAVNGSVSSPGASGQASTPVAATRHPEGILSSDAAIQRAQAPYMAINDEIYARLRASRSLKRLAGTRVDVPHGRFYVYYAGKVPPSIDALRSDAKREGIDLVVQRAAHSKSELVAATDQVSKVSGLPRSGYDIELATDGSGVTLRYPGTGTLSPSTLDAIAAIAASTGVPIQVHNRGLVFRPT